MDPIHNTFKMLEKRVNVTTSQAGVLGNPPANPAAYNSSDPIVLFIIQLTLILAFTQCLGWFFRRIRQPQVIAEVISGILLGPTVLGRAPKFSATIFPTLSLPYLNLVATIGLVLFLFLVGLEVDLSVVKKNYKSTLAISAAGIILPFGIGAGVAVPIYNQFAIDKSVGFGHFLLFVAVAMSITAFPVLCRILTDLKLLDTRVGNVVLSAGVGNDVVGWILLALTVTLVNSSVGHGSSSSGVTAVYILLCAVGWTLFLLFPVKRALMWAAIKSGSIERKEPTHLMMTIVLMLVMISAFFTDIIGVHPIFGGFLVGLIIPHEGNFAVALTKRIEDLVTILFLPIYFVLSGLKTNLGLLDNGITWGYTILLIVAAFFGKFLGCFQAAKLSGFNIRESLAVGSLMSCKGLVELIVLNVGLNAGILDQRTFSMFVFMAIVLTLMTTPLTLWFYPPSHRESIAELRVAKSIPAVPSLSATPVFRVGDLRIWCSKVLVVLHRIDHLPATMSVVSLLGQAQGSQQPRVYEEKGDRNSSNYSEHNTSLSSVDGLLLIELTGRTSSVMDTIELKDQILLSDPHSSTFTTFCHLNNLPSHSSISVVHEDSFTESVSSRAVGSDLVIVPWTIPHQHDHNENDELSSLPAIASFETVFGSDSKGVPLYSHFLRQLFADVTTDLALFVQCGPVAKRPHIFLPFFGGADDRAALALAVQLCHCSGISATVVRFERDSLKVAETRSTEASGDIEAHKVAMQKNMLTLYRGSTSKIEPAGSEDEDQAVFSYFESNSPSNVHFEDCKTAFPAESMLEIFSALASKSVMVIGGRARKTLSHAHPTESEVTHLVAQLKHTPTVAAEARRTFGDANSILVLQNKASSFLVIQAGGLKVSAPA